MKQLQYTFPLLKSNKPTIMKSRNEQLSMMKKTSKLQTELKIVIVVWNLQGILPPVNSTKKLMDSVIHEQQQPELICIATQECQRSINMSFFCQNKAQWENCLKETAVGYRLVQSSTMRALHTAILVKQQIYDCYTTQFKTQLKAGLCNMMGNKGAVNLVVNLLGQNLQFINCHLQAHQDQSYRRNQVLLKIIDNIVEKDYRNQVFICGDLNYRIQMTHEQYSQIIKGKQKQNTDKIMQYSKMLHKDQLVNQQILKSRFLPFYKQASIDFPPTYKIGADDQVYDRKRIPGWTDRIFHRKGRVRQVGYRCMYELFGTDHRPVIGTFKVQTQQTLSIFPDQFVPVKTSNACALI